jgi:hypothetical protein
MTGKESCWLIALLLAYSVSYGQQKLSPKFRFEGARSSIREMIFSVSFRDSAQFYDDYSERLTVVRRYGQANVFQIRADYDLIVNEFSGDPNILFVDIPGSARPESLIDHFNPGFNRITKLHHYFPELNGNEIAVSVKEKAFDANDIDLINRSFTTSATPTEAAQHATIMAILIAGAGNSSPGGKGVANAALLTSSDFENLLPDPDEVFASYTIWLQNHSYGVGVENYYGNEAMAYDQQVSNNPSLLHVFSAGNLGLSTPDDGLYKDLNAANLSGTFKQAKNVLLVTAVDSTLKVNPLNSTGPAYDGRLKPELTAFGQGGTSDAAALVTGTSAIVQQAYKQANDTLPPASMVKAILIASTDAIGPPGPDFVYGYGSVNAYRAADLVQQNFTSVVSLMANEEKEIEFVIPENCSEVKVVVAWTDPPASPGSQKALVHNIDAYLTDGTNQYLPWVLSSLPNPDSLASPARRKKDSLNNVEYFSIADPPSGIYQLVIQAPELTTQTQDVSVAFWIEDPTPFAWDYPSASDIPEAGEKHLLFWNNHAGGQGSLHYQLNGGEWKMIQETVDLSAPFDWNAPDTLMTARLKMLIGDDEYLSDAFLISPDLKVGVAFNCENEFSLTWNPVSGADGYEIFALGEQYMEKIATASNTGLTLAKSIGTEYFSVAPVFGSTVGLRSPTINYASQGSYCYINFFNAERFDETSIVVRLLLSTGLNIDHIVVSRLLHGASEILANVEVDSDLELEFTDHDLHPGAMTYQAELFFTDGTSLKSDSSQVFVEEKGRAILFPNPAPGGSYINVLSSGEGLILRVTDRIGRLLLEKELDDVLDFIVMDHYSSGLYFYQLVEDGRIIDTGKFALY